MLLYVKVIKGILKSGMKATLEGKILEIKTIKSSRGTKASVLRVEQTPNEVKEGWMEVFITASGDLVFFEKNRGNPIEFS